MAFYRDFENFANNTTLHGARKIIRSESTGNRVFWIVIFFGASILFCTQLIQLLQKYFSYDKSFHIEIIKNKADFPRVTVCDVRAIDIVSLKRIQNAFSESNDTLRRQLVLDYQDSFVEHVSTLYDDVKKISKNMRQVDDRFDIHWSPMMLLNINETVLQKGASQLQNVFVLCYDPDNCNTSRFQSRLFFLNSDPLQCFTYESDASAQESEWVATKKKYWWSLLMSGHGMKPTLADRQRLSASINKLFSSSFSSEGFLIFLHRPGTEFNMRAADIEVHLPPEHNAHLYVSMTSSKKLGEPYSTCLNSYPFQLQLPRIYSEAFCQDVCMQNAIVEQCGCKIVYLPDVADFSEIPFCSVLKPALTLALRDNVSLAHQSAAFRRIHQRNDCALSMLHANKSLRASCNKLCPSACEELQYDVSINLVRWPLADSILHDIGPSLMSKLKAHNDTERFELYKTYFEFNDTDFNPDYFNYRTLGRELSSVVVEMKSMDVTVTTEVVDYTLYQLLSDIGGQLGLWIGMSVISLTEMLELLINLMWTLIRIWKQHKTDNGNNNYRQKKETEV